MGLTFEILPPPLLNVLDLLIFRIIHLVGLITVTVLGIKYFSSKTSKWFTFNPKKLDPSKLGQYALITGATDGIGKEIAIELALCGFNLILLGRSDKKLQAAEDEIQSVTKSQNQSISIIKINFDFNSSAPITNFLDALLKDVDIGLLVNNVGASYPNALFFNEVSQELIDLLINVNLRSTYLMTHWVYKKMILNKRGMIICLGSGASQLPASPLYTVYSSVKAGIESFCKSLQVEAYTHNISIQCQTPLLVTSQLSKIRKSSLTVLSAKRYGKEAVKSIQNLKPALTGSTVNPYWVHRLQILAANISPTFSNRFIYNKNCQLRLKALKKQTN